MRGLLTQERVAASAGAFLDGLLSDERRKTGWMRAEAASDPGPWRQQAILGRGRWDADGLRDIVRDYGVERLGAQDAVLVIDETGFLKQGKASYGMARQYTALTARAGTAGEIAQGLDPAAWQRLSAGDGSKGARLPFEGIAMGHGIATIPPGRLCLSVPLTDRSSTATRDHQPQFGRPHHSLSHIFIAGGEAAFRRSVNLPLEMAARFIDSEKQVGDSRANLASRDYCRAIAYLTCSPDCYQSEVEPGSFVMVG